MSDIAFQSMGVITPELLRKFSIAGADPNPIHLDDVAAKRAGLKGPIAHGMLLATLMTSRLEQWLAKNEAGVLLGAQFRFKAMTFLGEEVFVGGKTGVIKDGIQEIELHAQSGGATAEIKTVGKFRIQAL